jgi:hypothetical protein
MTRMTSSAVVAAPSNCTRNSVLILLEASFSSEERWVSRESISSMNTTEGWRAAATANKARTVFSPSPIHLLVRDDADTLKNVAWHSCAMALPMSVLPVPGGPNSSNPLGSCRSPEYKCGFSTGHTTSSSMHSLANSSPEMSSNVTFCLPTRWKRR